MKRNVYSLSAALVLALAASSCAKDPQMQEPSSDSMSIVASSELGTKTSLDGINVLWNAGDAISVLYGTENKQFTTAESGATVSFTGEASPEAGQTVYAVYPYSASNAVTGENVVRVTIPEVQYATAGSFGTGANVTVGKVVDNQVTLFNVGGLIKLPIAGSDITSVTIRAKYDEATPDYTVIPVSGTFDVDLSGPAPVSTAYSTSHLVKLLPPAGQSVFTAGDYYIAVANVTMAKGFDIIYTKTSARGVKSTANSCTVSRAHVLPIAAQDGSIMFTAGKFIELVAVDESTRTPVQPFTVNMTVAGSNPSAVDLGIFYQNCPEEYMYDLSSSGTRGFFLTNGKGRTGIYYSGSDGHALFGLPIFAHKTLASVELYSTVTPKMDGTLPPVGGKVTTYLLKHKASAGKITAVLPWNGRWWPIAGSYSYGIAYKDIEVNATDPAVPYSLYDCNIRRLSLFYAGEDVEEVTSVKATVPSSIVKDDLPETLSCSFKSWNFGEGGATYVAGLDYKLSGADEWTTLTGAITGQDFTVELPNTLEIGTYAVRPWAGVDGADGTKIYGPEQALSITGELTEKTLTYKFLEGTMSSTSAAQWPFTDGNPNVNQFGTAVTIHDSAGNVLVADYTAIVTPDRSKTNSLVTGRGWRIRNSLSDAPAGTEFNDYFQLELPKFATLRLESVTITTNYTSADQISVVDASGTVLTGGAAAKPSTAGKTWALTGTAVNTVYKLKTVPPGTLTSVASKGFIFEPSSIVLHYVKPTTD